MEGIPFGFQAKALPVYIRATGGSLSAVSLSNLLSTAWLIKPVLAPIVDRVYWPSVGRRKSWILPLQLAMVVLCLGIAELDRLVHTEWLYSAIFVLNLCAAVQDIAIDGLAVDILAQEDMGKGNAAQVAGYKIGMLFGGGILLWASDHVGWPTLFYAIAAVILAAATVLYFYEEPPAPAPAPAPGAPAPGPGPASRRTVQQLAMDALWPLRNLYDAFWPLLRRRDLRWSLLLIATYKTGEAIIDVMFKPFLQDRGWSSGDIGYYNGIFGMVFSLLGSVAGGWIVDRITLADALLAMFLLRPWPLMGKVAIAFTPGEVTPAAMLAVTATESFFGGAITTGMFAFMMSLVDPAIGATQYSALCTLELIGRSIGGVPSGFVAETVGYHWAFFIGTAQAFAVVLLIPLVRSAHPHLHVAPNTAPRAGLHQD